MPKKLSSGQNYYGPSWLGEAYDGLFNTESWLYGEWTEEKYNVYLGLRNIPVFSNYMDYLLDKRRSDEYLNRHGMDYSNIHDPRKLFQTNSGTALIGGSLNFVSRNVTRLYR